jgi:integrase
MNLLEIQDDPVFADYLEEKVLKPRTIEIYSYHMKHYCEATGMSPTDLLEEAEDEEEERVPLRKTKLRQHLKTFEEFIKIKDFSKQHQQGAMTIIRNFYSFHDIRLPYAKPNKAQKTHETIEDIPSKEDIAKALGHCNHKYKAIILTMGSSGMGSSEVRGLKVQDFLDSISEYFNKPLELPLDIDQIRSKLSRNVIVPTFNIVRVKTSMPYSTFASPEAVNAIIDFLEKYPPKSPDNFLFPMSKRNIDKQITNNTFTLYFRRLNDTCNFDKVNRFRKFHSHALRKYFASTLINKDIKQWSIDAMLGHAVRNRTTGAYFKPDPKQIIGDYLKIVEDLSILEDVDIKHLETEEYKELKELKRAEKERKNEMEDMKNNLEKQNEVLEGLKEAIFIKSTMDQKDGRKILAKAGKDMSATELLDIIEERDKED